MLALILAAAAGPAAAQMSAACRADLAALEPTFEETLARLDSVANADQAAQCAAWHHHVTVMENARDVFMRCLTGFEQRENVGQMVVSIADFVDLIGRKCPRG
jgi:hypothetical protein